MAGKELQISQSADNEITTLKTILRSMSTDMRVFSLTMRSLYADKAVGGDSKCAGDFRKLRDATRNDAMVYLKGILPLSTRFVKSIGEYFQYYDALEFDEWCEMLPDILQRTAAHKKMAEELVKMHEDILVPLKKRQDEAYIILREYKDLQQEFEKKKKKLETSASTKYGFAIALAFVPYINSIAVPFLADSANLNMVEAIAKGAESKIQGAAALAVSESLLPALQRFIDGLQKAASFFSILESELASESPGSTSKPYYVMMKKEAKEMKSICQAFYAMLPAVRTDFEAIPTEGTDQNYVDRWLERQKKAILNRYHNTEAQQQEPRDSEDQNSETSMVRVAAGTVIQGTQLTEDLLKDVLNVLANVKRKCAIGVVNESGRRWQQGSFYFVSGGADESLPYSVDNAYAVVYGPRKTPGLVVAMGVVGVLAYYIPDIDKTFAVMFSVPFDYLWYENWWNAKLYPGNKRADDDQYNDLYHNASPFRADGWHERSLDSGLKFHGSMSNSGHATLEIHLRKE